MRRQPKKRVRKHVKGAATRDTMTSRREKTGGSKGGKEQAAGREGAARGGRERAMAVGAEPGPPRAGGRKGEAVGQRGEKNREGRIKRPEVTSDNGARRSTRLHATGKSGKRRASTVEEGMRPQDSEGYLSPGRLTGRPRRRRRRLTAGARGKR